MAPCGCRGGNIFLSHRQHTQKRPTMLSSAIIKTSRIASGPQPAHSEQTTVSFYRWLHHWSEGDYTVVYAPVAAIQMRGLRASSCAPNNAVCSERSSPPSASLLRVSAANSTSLVVYGGHKWSQYVKWRLQTLAGCEKQKTSFKRFLFSFHIQVQCVLCIVSNGVVFQDGQTEPRQSNQSKRLCN